MDGTLKESVIFHPITWKLERIFSQWVFWRLWVGWRFLRGLWVGWRVLGWFWVGWRFLMGWLWVGWRFLGLLWVGWRILGWVWVGRGVWMLQPYVTP